MPFQVPRPLPAPTGYARDLRLLQEFEHYDQLELQENLKQLNRNEGAESASNLQATLLRALADPRVRNFIEMASNPKVGEAVQAVVKHPKRTNLFYLEIGWLLFVMVLRAKVFSKPAHWFRRWIQGIAINVLFVLGASVIFPRVILGQPYFDVIGYFLEALGFKL